LNYLQRQDQGERAEKWLSKRAAGPRSAISAENYVSPGYQTPTSDDPNFSQFTTLVLKEQEDYPADGLSREVAGDGCHTVPPEISAKEKDFLYAKM
jgi:hypothetical protein